MYDNYLEILSHFITVSSSNQREQMQVRIFAEYLQSNILQLHKAESRFPSEEIRTDKKEFSSYKIINEIL